MWSIISWVLCLLSLVFIQKIPLTDGPKHLPGTVLSYELVSFIALTAFALAPPVRLGTIRAGSGVTRAGVYQGSLLLSTPGGALRPGSQAGLRRLIVSRTGSVLAALPKAAPRRWHSRSPQGAVAPCGSLRALRDARLSGWLPVLLVCGCQCSEPFGCTFYCNRL